MAGGVLNPHREDTCLRGEVPNSVLGKACLILEAFRAADIDLTLTELTQRTGIPKATVHRICGELVAGRVLERSGSGYRVGIHMFEVGLRAPRQRVLRSVAKPIMEDFAHAVNNPVHLSIPDVDGLLCIESVGGHLNRARVSRSGNRILLHCTAAGKVALAYTDDMADVLRRDGALPRRTPWTITNPDRLATELEQVREHGHSVEFEEHRVGYFAVAAPVLVRGDEFQAVLSVVAPTSGNTLMRLLPVLVAASRNIASRVEWADAYRTR